MSCPAKNSSLPSSGENKTSKTLFKTAQVHSQFAVKCTVCPWLWEIRLGLSLAHCRPFKWVFCEASNPWPLFPLTMVQSSQENLNSAGRLGLYTGPQNTSLCRGQSHQIFVASLGGRGAHFLTLWGLWVSEITLEKCCDGDCAVVRQQHRSFLAVSNRQDDTQVI